MTSSNSSEKNLILGLVKGYNFEQIKPFLVSLKKSGYQGDIGFVVSELSPLTLAALQDYAVNLYPFKEINFIVPFLTKSGKIEIRALPLYKLLTKAYFLNRINYLWSNLLVKILGALSPEKEFIIKSNITKRFVNTSCVRYPLYYLYLSRYGQNYSKIMLTDVRDVLFQRNPFDFEFEDGLCCFLEDEGQTIGSSEGNMAWLRQGFGDRIISQIADKGISCSGTTIGSHASIMRYLEAMVNTLLKLKAHPWGIDQGVHNYILYQGLVKNVKFYKNFQGPILTIHYLNDETLRFDKQGFLINEDGSIINVLHQYDRLKPEIKNKMLVYRDSECTT